MPNYFDYIKESAERYDEPEFVEESVTDSFNETIADMDLYCFQESLVVAGIAVGIAGLIALLIFIIKKVINGSSSGSGLKHQNKQMKKDVEALKKAGVDAVDCRPNKSQESKPSSPKPSESNGETSKSKSAEATSYESRSNRAVGDADFSYLQDSRKKNNRGAIPLGVKDTGKINYDEFKTKRSEPRASDSDKFGGKISTPIWEQPIYLIDDTTGGAFDSAKSEMMEFITLSIRLFELCKSPTLFKDDQKGETLTEIKRVRKGVDNCAVKKVSADKMLKIQTGVTPISVFEKHIARIDEVINELNGDLQALKRMQTFYSHHKTDTTKNKTNSPWENDKKLHDKFNKNVATCDNNLISIKDRNDKSTASVHRLRMAEAVGHVYSYGA